MAERHQLRMALGDEIERLDKEAAGARAAGGPRLPARDEAARTALDTAIR